MATSLTCETVAVKLWIYLTLIEREKDLSFFPFWEWSFIRKIRISCTQWCFVLRLIEIDPKKFKSHQLKIFSLLVYCEKGLAIVWTHFHPLLNGYYVPSLVWRKWLIEILLCCYYLPLGKNVALHLKVFDFFDF